MIMNVNAKASLIMSTDLKTVSAYDSLKDAQEMFSKHHLRHLPVVNGDALVGIMSLTDLMRISFGNTYASEEGEVDSLLFEMLNVGQVMKHKPDTVTSDTPIREVVQILSTEEFHALPVIDRGKLTGIVTTTDIMKYLLKVYAEEGAEA